MTQQPANETAKAIFNDAMTIIRFREEFSGFIILAFTQMGPAKNGEARRQYESLQITSPVVYARGRFAKLVDDYQDRWMDDDEAMKEGGEGADTSAMLTTAMAGQIPMLDAVQAAANDQLFVDLTKEQKERMNACIDRYREAVMRSFEIELPQTAVTPTR